MIPRHIVLLAAAILLGACSMPTETEGDSSAKQKSTEIG